MKLKQAIKILEEQKQKVLSSEYRNDRQLVIETASYIKDFFGLKSIEFNFINSFKFHVDFGVHVPDENKSRILKSKENDFIKFLDNCKSTLKNKRLFKEPKNNLLSNKNNAGLIGVIFSISLIVFSIGYYFGTEKTNNELIRIENKMIKLKDSLSSIKTIIHSKGMSNKEKKITESE